MVPALSRPPNRMILPSPVAQLVWCSLELIVAKSCCQTAVPGARRLQEVWAAPTESQTGEPPHRTTPSAVTSETQQADLVLRARPTCRVGRPVDRQVVTATDGAQDRVEDVHAGDGTLAGTANYHQAAVVVLTRIA